jgi:stage III sporulation protein AH
MKIINKNELTVLVIALMLVTAGYLDYIGKNKTEEASSISDVSNNEIIGLIEATTEEEEEEIASTGDAKLVNGEAEETIETSEVTAENAEQTTETSSNGNSSNTEEDDSYFVSSKLERTKMYSQTIENYQKILENQNVSEEQKAIATQEISNITQTQNAIMICENLLLAKGFDKCVIFVNDKSISAIIGKDNLTQEEIAQIQNIISRELNAEADNIHISTK